MRLFNCITVLVLALAAGFAYAAPQDWVGALSGRLQRIKETGVIRLGYRENAIPFSFLGPDGKPVGYSLDLCAAIAATIADNLGGETIGIEYVRVTAQDRIERVVSGAVDLECGSTTNTAQRRRQVAFSPVIFVTGTRLAVLRGSNVRDANDLRGLSVIVIPGTTNDATMRELDRLRGLALKFVTADDYRRALDLLASGRAAALAADEILLRGLLAETGRVADFRLVGEMLSFEPYGIMYPRDDPALADAVDGALRHLAESREIIWLYERWFVRKLPSGQRLELPMSTELRRSFELIGLPTD